MGLAGGEVVAGVFGIGVEVVELGVDEHGDGGFGGAVGEEDGVFVGDCDGVGVVGGGRGRGREFAEGEEVQMTMIVSTCQRT